MQISSSNFHLTAAGNVSASNIDISGGSAASVILNKSVTITAANSSSYLQLVDAVEPSPGSPPYYKLILNGQLGGQIVQKVIIGCQFGSYNQPSSFYNGVQLTIADIVFPTSSNGTATCIIEVSSSRVYFRDDVGAFIAGSA